MEIEIGNFHVTAPRLLVFAALVGAFFWWFGFWPGEVPRGEYFSHRRVTRAYFACATLFVVAAAIACFGEHEYGMFPPTSLRPVLIVLGALLMLAAVAWMHSLRTGYLGPRPHQPALSLHPHGASA